jgi:hypothetical protein
MSYEEEFKTVGLIRNSIYETRGVDAFALSLIKAERQMRKLFTYLVYQNPCFCLSDIPSLREALAKSHKVYFSGFINGFNEVYPRTIDELIGQKYHGLKSKIEESIRFRNKIFHGQLTGKDLSRKDLFQYVDNISEWCRLLADNAQNEIGYNGFSRNSFQKSEISTIYMKYKIQFGSIEDYTCFIREHLERRS